MSMSICSSNLSSPTQVSALWQSRKVVSSTKEELLLACISQVNCITCIAIQVLINHYNGRTCLHEVHDLPDMCGAVSLLARLEQPLYSTSEADTYAALAKTTSRFSSAIALLDKHCRLLRFMSQTKKLCRIGAHSCTNMSGFGLL